MEALSEERLAPSNGIELAYQEVGDPDGEPMLLIMGLGTQMLAWDEELCSMLAERGFRVIRFDNRDIGHSTMIDSAGMPGRLDMMRGRRDHAPYLLTDMADDAFGLMDHLGIDAAHVVGASMGGMIAQTMAITQPERVSSLVSMMSTTGNRRVGWPHWRALPILFADYPRSREAYISQVARTFEVIGSPGLPARPPAPRGSGGADVGPLPQSRRRAAPDVRGHAPPETGPRRCESSTFRPPCSTAPPTGWSARPEAGPPPRRSPAPDCGCSRAWATTCRASSGPSSSRRSSGPSPAAPTTEPASVLH